MKAKDRLTKMNIKLPKKFEMRNRDYPFVYDENWISNGQFMIKKEAVKDSFRYCLPSEEAKAECNRVVPQETDSEWFKTDTIYDSNIGFLRVFKCDKLNKTICFSEEYIKHFGVISLKGNSAELNNPFISFDGITILMPCRNQNTDFT